MSAVVAPLHKCQRNASFKARKQFYIAAAGCGLDPGEPANGTGAGPDRTGLDWTGVDRNWLGRELVRTRTCLDWCGPELVRTRTCLDWCGLELVGTRLELVRTGLDWCGPVCGSAYRTVSLVFQNGNSYMEGGGRAAGSGNAPPLMPFWASGSLTTTSFSNFPPSRYFIVCGFFPTFFLPLQLVNEERSVR